jgi:uncharacterized protein
MKPTPLKAVLLVLVVFTTWTHGAEPPLKVLIPMMDGIELVTDVYLPGAADEGPWPVILARSTYGRIGGPIGEILQQGIAVVVQDVRGMGASKGEKFVFHADGWQEGLQDGAETVAWVRAQPWCNGKIGTWGGSALGITQMLMAPVTDGVAAQFIEVAPSNLYEDMFYQGGVFRKALLEGWLPQIGQTHLLEVYKSHPRYDDFWAFYNVEARAGDITAPALFVGGWYDIFNQGTIDGFTSREHEGGLGAKGNNYLIMKWSTHGADVTKDYTLNENRYALHIPQHMGMFYAGYLLEKRELLGAIPKVQYYVMGADTEGAPGNEWRSADAWPPFPTVSTPYYLRADGSLSATAPSSADTAHSFVFDPANPVPTHGGANLVLPAGPFDQRKVIAGREDVLVFSSAPLEKPLEVTGRITVRLFVSSDAPDTDFTAKLVDIYPAGDDRQILMLDSIRRVKSRLGYDQAAPALTGPEEVVELKIDLQSISWIFDEGHRIGLHVSSSNYPRFELNPNNGADFPESGQAGRAATNTVHLSSRRPSAIYLPVR